MPFLPADMVREIGHFLDEKSFKNWRQTCSFFARETFNDLVKREKNKPAIKQVAIASEGMLFLQQDGTVWVYGNNNIGQLGLVDNCKKVIQTPSLTEIAQLSAGRSHTLFLKKDGTVLGCGENRYGELGCADYRHRELGYCAIPFPQLTGVAQVTAGSYQSAFLKKDGTVWMCGSNKHGKLGLVNPNEWRPTQIPNLNDIMQISLGDCHSLFLKNDGTVWGCGSNSSGQLGLGNKKRKSTPKQIPGLTEIIQVAAGRRHSIFLKKDGSVWVCGHNFSGALGLGDYNDRYTPTQISTISEITQIFANKSYHSVFQTKDGNILACGNNYNGILGLGNDSQPNIPTRIPGLMHIKQVTSDMTSLLVDRMALFLKKDGEVLVGGLLGGKSEFQDYRLHFFPELIPSNLNQIQTLEAYHAETKYMRKSF